MIKKIVALATLITALTPSIGNALPNTDATRYALLQRAYANNAKLVSLVNKVAPYSFTADLRQIRAGEKELLLLAQNICKSHTTLTPDCEDSYRKIFARFQKNYKLYFRMLNLYR